MNNEHIKIWTRYSVPDEFKELLMLYDEDDGDGNTIENASFIAHIPLNLLNDNLINISYKESDLNNIEVSKIFGEGMFGSNGIDIVKHQKGDGYLVVGGCV